MADALMKSGDADLSSTFLSLSMVLVRAEDGSLQNATESDPVMSEKFNMFDAIRSNIEFKQSKGLSTERDISALSFLEKFKMMGDFAQIDTYA